VIVARGLIPWLGTTIAFLANRVRKTFLI